jgi:carbonic anhydrase
MGLSSIVTFPHRLLDGYRQFSTGRLQVEQDRYRELAEHGQSPEIMVIGCCDSRVSPEVIFDARPGELFVARNVANLVPPHSPDTGHHGISAALEFAVQALAVKHIVVLGHARCGGIRYYAEQAPPLAAGDFIGRWMSLIAPAAARIGPLGAPTPEYLTQLELGALAGSLDNLMTFPYVRHNVEQGRLAIHAAYFDVATGSLSVRDPATGAFAEAGRPDR